MSTGPIERLKRTEHPAARYALLRSRGALHYLGRGHAVRRREIARYLATHRDPALHVGAGPKRLDGWLNCDLIAGDVYLDLERPLPLPDGCLAYAFGEHVLGALSESGGQALLGELRRVLRPGGVLRIATPDLVKLIALYRDENEAASLSDYAALLDTQTGRPHLRACQVFNDLVRSWGIRWTYDEEDLTAKLREAGFGAVRRREPGESLHPALRGLERHEPEWANRAEDLCLEAEVPA